MIVAGNLSYSESDPSFRLKKIALSEEWFNENVENFFENIGLSIYVAFLELINWNFFSRIINSKLIKKFFKESD